jgi:hypothetical protein
MKRTPSRPPPDVPREELLKLYSELESAHRRLLEFARAENWEASAGLSARIEALTSRIATLDAGALLDEAGRASVREHIERTRALIGELRALAEPALVLNAEMLADNAQRSKIAGAYGA